MYLEYFQLIRSLRHKREEILSGFNLPCFLCPSSHHPKIKKKKKPTQSIIKDSLYESILMSLFQWLSNIFLYILLLLQKSKYENSRFDKSGAALMLQCVPKRRTQLNEVVIGLLGKMSEITLHFKILNSLHRAARHRLSK